MKWINVEDQLPEDGAYVLAYHNRETWVASDPVEQENIHCVVVKFRRGISKRERTLMQAGEIADPVEPFPGFRPSTLTRSMVTRGEDEYGNNQRPYCWDQFGPGSFFGQEITHWMPLPGAPK